jgi:hypothetical protein
MVNNEYFLGRFANDKMNGEGKYYYANRDRYVGHWINGHKTGQGEFIKRDGSRYKRNYSELLR